MFALNQPHGVPICEGGRGEEHGATLISPFVRFIKQCDSRLGSKPSAVELNSIRQERPNFTNQRGICGAGSIRSALAAMRADGERDGRLRG